LLRQLVCDVYRELVDAAAHPTAVTSVSTAGAPRIDCYRPIPIAAVARRHLESLKHMRAHAPPPAAAASAVRAAPGTTTDARVLASPTLFPAAAAAETAGLGAVFLSPRRDAAEAGTLFAEAWALLSGNSRAIDDREQAAAAALPEESTAGEAGDGGSAAADVRREFHVSAVPPPDSPTADECSPCTRPLRGKRLRLSSAVIGDA
jgi:hypothetical protein